MRPVIGARGLTHEHPDGTTVLRDVTVTVEAGERVTVIGANGSGKNTLQRMPGGLVEPTTGTVKYTGETMNTEVARDRLGVLLQDPDDYLFNTTVREDIKYGPTQLGMLWQATAQRAAHLAAELGLESLLDRPPLRLSGDKEQWTVVANVLAFELAMLLPDEPFGTISAGYRECILGLVTDHEGTMVLFTPSVDAVPEIVDRVLAAGQDGSIAVDGSVRDVLVDATLLRNNGLRPPTTVQLLEETFDVDDVSLTASEARAHLLDQAWQRTTPRRTYSAPNSVPH